MTSILAHSPTHLRYLPIQKQDAESEKCPCEIDNIKSSTYKRALPLPPLRTSIGSQANTDFDYASYNKTKNPPITLRNLIYRRAWDRVEQACRSRPSQARVTDELGDLPLHEACRQAAPLHVIKNLLTAHPEGIKSKGFCGRLPLHYASYNNPSLNAIKLLLKKYPGSASIKDSDGRLPVHLAVTRNAPEEVIRTLIVAFPECLITRNNFGSTPQMLARTYSVRSVFQEEEVRPIDSMQQIQQRRRVPNRRCQSL